MQSRGNGWADTFSLGDCSVLINIAGLNKTVFNPNKTTALIQGGALVNDMILAAYGNDTRFAGPTCACLSFLGASLGGGLTREMGLYGTGVDQIVSANVVTASGESLLVDSTHNPDLWYAIRGAAPNFGIVTSAVVRAYPTTKAENIVWQGSLTYPDDKLEELIQIAHDLVLEPRMEIDLLFATSGPPLYTPTISAIPFFLGNASEGEKVFAPLLELGPIANNAAVYPYPEWSDFAIPFCEKGLRKPAYGASLSTKGFVPKTWRAIYSEYKAFVKAYPQAGNSSILAEYYPLQKAIAIGDNTSSYPFREVPLHVVIIPTYADSSLDDPANTFGARVRDLMWSTDGLAQNSS